jgi:hypothetical protein
MRTSKGSYVLKELDGTQSRAGIAGFRLLKYYPATANVAHLVKDPIHKLGDRLDSNEEYESQQPSDQEAGDYEEVIDTDLENVQTDIEDNDSDDSEHRSSEYDEDLTDESPISQHTRSRR